MKLKVHFEWVRATNEAEFAEVIGLNAHIQKEDGTELCTIEVEEDDPVLMAPMSEDGRKSMLMSRMGKELEKVARSQLG